MQERRDGVKEVYAGGSRKGWKQERVEAGKGGSKKG